jgi:hypothetical protein
VLLAAVVAGGDQLLLLGSSIPQLVAAVSLSGVVALHTKSCNLSCHSKIS